MWFSASNLINNSVDLMPTLYRQDRIFMLQKYTLNRYNIMGYRFIRDIHIEEPCYHTIARMLNGNKLQETLNGKTSYQVECPCCKKKKARMGYSK